MIIDPENVPRRTTSIYPDQFKVNKIKRRVGTAHQNLVIPIPKMIATNEYLGRGTALPIGVNLRSNPLLNARSRPLSFPRSAWECITGGSASS